MLKQRFWRSILLEFCLVIGVASIIGYFIGHLIVTIIVALTCLLIWIYYNLYKLSSWIWQYNNLYPPHSIGLFDTIFYGLHKRQKRIRQRQNELAEIIKRFRHGAESIPDSLLLTDIHGKIEWMNNIAQHQLDIRWPDDQGQNIINLIRHPEFASYMKKKDFSTPLTLFFKHQKHIEFRVIPYIDDHWIIIARDVDQLYLAEKQRHDFFTNASHELRTPLTVLKSYLEMFSDEMIPNTEKERILLTMQAQVDRMESLTTQILALSRIENNPIEHQLQAVDIPTMLDKIKHNIQQVYSAHYFQFDIDHSLFVLGQKEQLYSVVNNLIYNAAKHTPEQTHITIEWKKTIQGAYFSVSDNGPGIAKQHLPRLTERFYQVDNARTTRANSSGLGLAIVKHALLNHGKTQLVINSELGKGSRFSFTLPSHLICNNAITI